MCSPLKIISRTALVVLTLTSPLCAEETPLPFASQMKLARPTFAKGQRELAVNASAMFSPCIVSDDRPTVNYSAAAIQYGRMLTDVRGDGFWRGNTELLGEVLAAASSPAAAPTWSARPDGCDIISCRKAGGSCLLPRWVRGW